jgi:hypothetical protein
VGWVLTISKLKRRSINYYIDIASAAARGQEPIVNGNVAKPDRSSWMRRDRPVSACVRPSAQQRHGRARSSVILAGVIDASWIDFWADRYPVKSDDEVLNHVGARVRERGHYDRQDFVTVGTWKSPRVKSRMASNTDEMIRDISATAFGAPLAIQHRILTLLEGVQVPMASSLLMVWQPDQHTVIDVRAVKSLVKNGLMPDPTPNMYPPYMEYLAMCKTISVRCRRSLRLLDRALYEANGRT